MGESPDYVYNFGSPGIDQIKRIERLSRDEIEKQIGYTFQKKNLLVTFHPETLEEHSPESQFQKLLDALDLLGSDTGVIFTYPNADPAGRALIPMIDSFVAEHPQAKAYASLGQLRYLSVMAQVDAVVGNSSSGLYETPSFKIPTVNIGDRQKGRLQAASVTNCAVDTNLIGEAINAAFAMDCSAVINPFGDGDSSQKVKDILKNFQLDESLLKKHFFNLR